jgi:nicotinamidase/pyrazinamidase
MNALILVDVQNDFCPGGSLPVAGGFDIVPVIIELQPLFELVVATKDWHPKDHSSFAVNHNRQPYEMIQLGGITQVLWPAHCIQGSQGADLAAGLKTHRIAKIFYKGVDPAIDSYSGFFDNGRRRATGLAEYLKARGVTIVWIVGLATDYCVKWTALDAKQLGFHPTVILDACRGVNLKPGDVDRAIEEMKAAGIEIVQSADALKARKGAQAQAARGGGP